jgi:O-acetyl-ADP-ribose deacetylase (regulator of RNase III)
MEVVLADATRLAVGAIIPAANQPLPGGGAHGATHRAAGPAPPAAGSVIGPAMVDCLSEDVLQAYCIAPGEID